MTQTLGSDDESPPATKGELKLCDLPPIEDLRISVPAEKLVKIGKIVSIVDVLVVVGSIRSMPPLDLDTILFKSDGTTIGEVFDTFGTVTEPHYSIRFTNAQQIKDKGLETDQEVYFSPQSWFLENRVITKFAFINELRKIKGTDASGRDDNERPQSCYNSDEDEADSDSHSIHSMP